MKYIKRDNYLRKVIPFIDKQIIKVIVGQRRVGKSYFLKQVADHIRSENPGANIIFHSRAFATRAMKARMERRKEVI